MNFVPISILAYVLNGGSILIAKFQLQKTIPNPLSYAFYTSILQLLVIFLIPFGFSLNFSQTALLFSVFSGVSFALALLFFMQSIKDNEASVAGPVVGGLNPLFTLSVGALFLGQVLTGRQTLAYLLLIIGALILTSNLWLKKLSFSRPLLEMVAAGFLFGLSYVFLREVFLQTNFINGLVLSRVSGGLFVIPFLLIPQIRKQVFNPPKSSSAHQGLTIATIFFSGQIMSALSSLLLFYATSLTNPALVNAFFGFQYLTILIVALILFKKHVDILDEKLTRNSIFQKVVAVAILSSGLYLLAQ